MPLDVTVLDPVPEIVAGLVLVVEGIVVPLTVAVEEPDTGVEVEGAEPELVVVVPEAVGDDIMVELPVTLEVEAKKNVE